MSCGICSEAHGRMLQNLIDLEKGPLRKSTDYFPVCSALTGCDPVSGGGVDGAGRGMAFRADLCFKVLPLNETCIVNPRPTLLCSRNCSYCVVCSPLL